MSRAPRGRRQQSLLLACQAVGWHGLSRSAWDTPPKNSQLRRHAGAEVRGCRRQGPQPLRAERCIYCVLPGLPPPRPPSRKFLFPLIPGKTIRRAIPNTLARGPARAQLRLRCPGTPAPKPRHDARQVRRDQRSSRGTPRGTRGQAQHPSALTQRLAQGCSPGAEKPPNTTSCSRGTSAPLAFFSCVNWHGSPLHHLAYRPRATSRSPSAFGMGAGDPPSQGHGDPGGTGTRALVPQGLPRLADGCRNTG